MFRKNIETRKPTLQARDQSPRLVKSCKNENPWGAATGELPQRRFEVRLPTQTYRLSAASTAVAQQAQQLEQGLQLFRLANDEAGVARHLPSA